MNKTLQAIVIIHTRAELKIGLAQCTDGQQMKFKRMYSYKNLELPIDDVVDKMPNDKLDWALQQVENTIKQNTKKGVKE